MIKPGFKQTEIGLIPEDWEVTRLGNVCKLTMGQSPPSSSYNDIGNGLPFFQGNVDFGDKHPKIRLFCDDPRKIAEDGDILISVRAPVGELNIADRKCCIGRGLAAIKPKNENSRDFVFHSLKHSTKKLIKRAQGSTFKAIGKKELFEFKIPLPPLLEQKKIAEILSTADEDIQKTDEIITKTQEFKKGMMQQLLTRGIGHTRFKKTEIGEIPEEWKVAKVKELGTVVTGTTPRTSVGKYWNGKFPFVTPTDISSTKYVEQTGRTITKEGAERGRIIPKDAVLVTCIASIGKMALASESCITNQQINAITCNSNVNPHYVYYAIGFRTGILKTWAGQSQKPIIKKSLFEKFPIPLPTLPEQQKIAEILSTADEKIEIERKRKEKLEELKKGLMQNLLIGKVRVKIDQNG